MRTAEMMRFILLLLAVGGYSRALANDAGTMVLRCSLVFSTPRRFEHVFHRGRAAVGHIHFSDGKFVNTDAVDNFTENWSQIVDTPLLMS